MSERIAISVTLCGLSRLFGDELSGVVRAARLAEEAGVDQIVLPDHLAVGPRTDRYPYGRFPYPNEEPWLEPLTALAAIAGATRRIRLGTGVLIAPLRPALLLAKTLATLDALSDGRVDLGVGTGWQREEFAAAGVPFRGRTARLDDTLRACRALWSEAPASFHSETVSFSDVWCLPRPVQSGGIPIWIGGALTEGNVGRIVEYGRGWMPMACGLEELEAGIARLRGAFAEAGRDPAGLEVRAAAPLAFDSRGRVDVERSLAALPRLHEIGATAASFALDPFARKPADVGPFFERLGQLGA